MHKFQREEIFHVPMIFGSQNYSRKEYECTKHRRNVVIFRNNAVVDLAGGLKYPFRESLII